MHRNLVSGGGSVGDSDDDDGLLELTGSGGAEDKGLEDLLVERSSERGETWYERDSACFIKRLSRTTFEHTIIDPNSPENLTCETS